MKLTDFEVLTFDCYGTLIDWESGIHTALEHWLAGQGTERGRDEALAAFAQAESAQQRETPDLLNPQILAKSLRRLATRWNLAASADDAARFGASVKDWPAFADSAAALAYLKRHYKLVILSNVDRTSFAASNEKLGVAFDAVYTAQDVGSYKPDPANFDYLISHLKHDLGIEKGQILHTAQSLFHDHVPATAAGLATAWIDRRRDEGGYGATPPPPGEARIDFHFGSLAEFAEAHRACRQRD